MEDAVISLIEWIQSGTVEMPITIEQFLAFKASLILTSMIIFSIVILAGITGIGLIIRWVNKEDSYIDHDRMLWAYFLLGEIILMSAIIISTNVVNFVQIKNLPEVYIVRYIFSKM